MKNKMLTINNKEMQAKSIVLILSVAFMLLLNACQGTVARQPVAVPASAPEKTFEEQRPEESVATESEEPEATEEPEPVALKPDIIRMSARKTGLVRDRLEYYQQNIKHWAFLDEKVNILNMKLKKKTSWQQCGSFYQNMIDEYEQLLFQTDQAERFRESIWGVLDKDFDYMRMEDQTLKESFFQRKNDVAVKDCTELMVGRAQAVINYYADRNHHEEVVDVYDLINNYLNGAEIPDGMKESYGKALIETGNLNEGLDVFMGILEGSSEKTVKSLALRKEAISYLIAVGDIDRARSQLVLLDNISRFSGDARQMTQEYNKLLTGATAKELRLYGEALRSWLVSDKKEMPAVLRKNVAELEQNAPESQAAVMGMLLREHAEKRLEKYAYRELSLAVDLVKKNRYSEALEIVDRLSQGSLPTETLEKVRKTETAIREKQARDKQQRERLAEEALETKWNKAIGYLDVKEYDKASEYFRALLDTPYRQQAGKKLNEAVRLAAAAKREKAAELFIKAREVGDMEAKVDFLQRSRQLLLEIKEKYPESGMINKVEKNLGVVEESLLQIDPDLLNGGDETDTGGGTENSWEAGWF